MKKIENENISEPKSDSVEEWEELLENDEISPEEEGFMIGWLNATDTDENLFEDDDEKLMLEELDENFMHNFLE